MNIAGIRMLINTERPDATLVAAACREALDNPPASVAEQAEIQYYWVQADFTGEPWLAAKYANEARKATKLAIEAECFLLAVKAICLDISLLNVALPNSLACRVSDMREWKQVLVEQWQSMMDPDDFVCAVNEFDRLRFAFVRQEQDARHAS